MSGLCIYTLCTSCNMNEKREQRTRERCDENRYVLCLLAYFLCLDSLNNIQFWKTHVSTLCLYHHSIVDKSYKVLSRFSIYCVYASWEATRIVNLLHPFLFSINFYLSWDVARKCFSIKSKEAVFKNNLSTSLMSCRVMSCDFSLKWYR